VAEYKPPPPTAATHTVISAGLISVESKETNAVLSAKVISKLTIPALLPTLLSIRPLQPISQVIPEISNDTSAFATTPVIGSIAVAGIVRDSGSGDEQEGKINVAASITVYFITLFFTKLRVVRKRTVLFVTNLPHEHY
tara:strand:+ start:2302 stop:2718 length:417 start_codon:yes stop_codon:yes gene_type:complete